jgi:hypothetical protein
MTNWIKSAVKCTLDNHIYKLDGRLHCHLSEAADCQFEMIIKCVTCLTRETRRRHSLIVSVRRSSQHSETRITHGVPDNTVCRVRPSRIPAVIMNNNADNASTYALSVINARQTPGVENSLFLRRVSVYRHDLDVEVPLRPFYDNGKRVRVPRTNNFLRD